MKCDKWYYFKIIWDVGASDYTVDYKRTRLEKTGVNDKKYVIYSIDEKTTSVSLLNVDYMIQHGVYSHGWPKYKMKLIDEEEWKWASIQ